jgi:glycosyltransferase involved in cell wall biosynthesis
MSPGSLEFVIPGNLEAATGGYGYDRRMIAGLRARGWRVAVHALDGSFPQPSTAALAQAHEVVAGFADGSLVLIDGLALGAMPRVVQPHARRLRIVGLVHHPLAAEHGLAPDLAQRLAHSEAQALQLVRQVIVTSPATRLTLLDLGVAPSRISVVEPGTDTAMTRNPNRGTDLNFLCVATLIPRKGHDLLFDALASLAASHWHLHCAGSLTRHPATAAHLRIQLQRAQLADRVTLHGEVDRTVLAQLYAAADLFVLPTRLEGFGMAVAEALAHGVPVISTRVGAIAELVGADAGILVAPEDVNALREALRRVLSEPGCLADLSAGAARARARLPDWSQASARMAAALDAVAL